MDLRRAACLCAVSVLTLAALRVPGARAAGAKPPPVCGPALPPGAFVEPPDVDVSALPRNAAGRHELILIARRDKDRFCYRYRWDGVEQTSQPTIRVHRGERFALRLVNEITGPSPGENVASTALPPCTPMAMPPVVALEHPGYLHHTSDVRYMRMKPVDTNIHLHGFEGPAAQENIFLSSLSTPMHACEYDLTVPRTQPPGTYFYHSHTHGTSEVEVFLGLSGMWIVEPDLPQLPRVQEHPVILRYVVPEVDDNPYFPVYDSIFNAAAAHEGLSRPALPVRYDPFHPPAMPSTVPMRSGHVAFDASACSGAFNAPLLSINGAKAAVAIDVAADVPHLFRILNATADSIKLLRLRDALGHRETFKVVARDGIPVGGDYDRPLATYETMDTLPLPPAGRADILVTPQAGTDLTLYSDRFCAGTLGESVLKHDLLVIHPATGLPGATARLDSAALDVHRTAAAKLVAYAHANPSLVRRRAFTYTEYVLPKTRHAPEQAAMFLTETTDRHFREHQYWPVFAAGQNEPVHADVVVKAGSVEEWTLFNTTLEPHSFHIHQMAFAVENDVSGGPAMLDTVIVPLGKMLPNRADPNYPLVQPSATRIVLDFRHVPRGTFVFHCHMLFHEDHGMMGVVRVE